MKLTSKSSERTYKSTKKNRLLLTKRYEYFNVSIQTIRLDRMELHSELICRIKDVATKQHDEINHYR